jgi:hypothetical protein
MIYEFIVVSLFKSAVPRAWRIKVNWIPSNYRICMRLDPYFSMELQYFNYSRSCHVLHATRRSISER